MYVCMYVCMYVRACVLACVRAYVCMYVCTYVPTYVCIDESFSSTSKGKPSLSNKNAITDFRQTWYVGNGGTSTAHVVCHHQMRIFNTSLAYLF